MAIILCIETATKACSVALIKDGEVLSIREQSVQYSHSELVTVYIEEILFETGISLSDLDAVAVSKGPGSYTGLRIGVSAAKGLCFGLDIPLIGVNTLQSMAAGINLDANGLSIDKVLFCPMLDARRMEVYFAVYDINNTEIQQPQALIINENSFSDILKNHLVYFFGDGSTKCKDKIIHENAIFLDNHEPSARYMAAIAQLYFEQAKFENVAYFEPYYLKDFVAGAPKVKGLNQS